MPASDDAGHTLRSARMVFGLNAAFVLLFAGLALFLASRGTVPIAPESPEIQQQVFYGWLVVIIGLWLVAGKVWRGTLKAMRAGGRGASDGEDRLSPNDALKRFVIIAALAEGIGLAGVIDYMFTGHTGALVVSLVITALALARYFPRRDWFAPLADPPAPEADADA